MRLGQLARKLALRPDQIIEFLAKKNIQIVEGSNTRLEDNQVAMIIEKFAPKGFDIAVQELTPQGAVQQMEMPEIPTTPEVEELEVTSRVEETRSEIPMLEEKSEVIKAPKVELSGLKVLGKIDLPEPKKKEQPKVEFLSDGEKPKPQERVRSVQTKNPKINSRPAKNPITLQREREELEAQKKREAAKTLDREKRAQHYFNKVKVVAPVKSAKRNQIEEEIDAPAPRPKTLLGRFFRWFNT